MTTRWEKKDQHLEFIVEGPKANAAPLRLALDIDIEGNILINAMNLKRIEDDTIKFLEAFALKHKARNFSVVMAHPQKLKIKKLEITRTISEARDIIFMEATERELGLFDE
jgi:hypothetical protein